MGEGCTGGCQSSEPQPHGVLCVEPTFWNEGKTGTPDPPRRVG